MRLVALLLLASTSYESELVDRAKRADLASALTWRRLVHYEPRNFGDGFISTADTPTFFLAEDGKTDPEAELVATLRAFFADPEAQCRFPARRMWLAKELGIDERLPKPKCEKFEWWKGRLNGESATLVFAAAYLNNPASMFGHTFLRLNKKRRGKGADLVAYTVNFAAVPTTENAIAYTFLGLAGGFPGMYSTMPYYMKVKEYTDLEDRDLWEYDLSLEPDEIERLVAHLWELGKVGFDYYYFDENCSYHLLSLLEVARPSLELTSQFGPYAIPADTLRVVLEQEGLVVGRRYRPSRWAEMLGRRAVLDGDERDLAVEIAEGERAPTLDLEPERAAAVLDAALALLRYRSSDDEDPPKKRERAILLARGKLRTPSIELNVESGEPPDESHESTYVAAGGGVDSDAPFASFELRFALHDLLGYPTGYVRGSQIEFVRTQIRVPIVADRGFEPSIETIRVLDIVSLSPIDTWAFRVSWRLATGLERQRPGGLFYGIWGGPGLALDVFGFAMLYAFVEAELGAGPAFEDSVRAMIAGRGGVLIQIARPLRLQAEARYALALPTGEGRPYRLFGGVALNPHKDVELRGGVVAEEDYESLNVMVRYAF